MSRLLTLTFLTLPALAFAHPGHSAFDPTQVPHAGHAWEYAVLAGAIIGGLALAFFAGRKNQS
jgi:hypothetical protein